MCGCGSGANLAALPIPLGSTLMLLKPPTLAGPGGTPLMATLPAPASPAIRANEAAGRVRRTKARAILAEVLDMTLLQACRLWLATRRDLPRARAECGLW